MQTIAKNTATAGLRRVKFSLYDSTNPLLLKDVVVTGIKGRIHYADGTSAAAAGDIVKVGSGTTVQYYQELTQAESNVALGNSALVVDATSLSAAMEVVNFIIGPLETFDSPADPAGVTTLLARVTAVVPIASDYSAARATKLDQLDAAISSRSTYAGGDTSGVTTLLARLTALRAAALDLIDAAISTTATPAQVRTQVDAALDATAAEATAPPAAISSIRQKIGWIGLLSRNKVTQTATTQIVKADDGATTVGTSTVSDDGTTATRGKFS